MRFFLKVYTNNKTNYEKIIQIKYLFITSDSLKPLMTQLQSETIKCYCHAFNVFCKYNHHKVLSHCLFNFFMLLDFMDFHFSFNIEQALLSLLIEGYFNNHRPNIDKEIYLFIYFTITSRVTKNLLQIFIYGLI